MKERDGGVGDHRLAGQLGGVRSHLRRLVGAVEELEKQAVATSTVVTTVMDGSDPHIVGTVTIWESDWQAFLKVFASARIAVDKAPDRTSAE